MVNERVCAFLLTICLVMCVASSALAASFPSDDAPQFNADSSTTFVATSDSTAQTADLPALPFAEESSPASERAADMREQLLGDEFYLYRSTLSAEDQALYDDIYEVLESGNTHVFLPNSDGDWEHITSIIFDVIRDHPELFWLYTQCYYSYDNNTRYFEADVYSYDLVEDLSTARRHFEESVEPVISFASTFGSDAERAKVVHDWLIQAVNYSWDGYNQSAYGAFVERAAVCTGYTRAYQYCLQKLGIRAAFIGNWDHAWNLVQLGSEYYVVDVTSDDPDSGLLEQKSEDEGASYYSCFNITDEQMAQLGNRRDPWSARLPEALGTEYSAADYFNGVMRLTDCSRINSAIAALPAPPSSAGESDFELTIIVRALQQAQSIQGSSILQEASDNAGIKENEVLTTIATATSLQQNALQSTTALDPVAAAPIRSDTSAQASTPATTAQSARVLAPGSALDATSAEPLSEPIAQPTRIPAPESIFGASSPERSAAPAPTAAQEPGRPFSVNVVTVSNRLPEDTKT